MNVIVTDMKYYRYRQLLLRRLVAEARKCNPNLRPGIWQRTGALKDHILPLAEGCYGSEGKAKAISDSLDFDVRKALPSLRGLHRYAHHLNSSQLMCMVFFVPLTEDAHRLCEFIRSAFGIHISPEAKCHFEYARRRAPYIFKVGDRWEYEGTVFDFHISDGETELFF